MLRSSLWRRAVLFGVIAALLSAYGVLAAPRQAAPTQIVTSSDEIVPIQRGYGYDEPQYVQGEIIVKLKSLFIPAGSVERSVAEQFSALNESMGASVTEEVSLSAHDASKVAYLVRLPEGMDLADGVARYSSQPFVEYAEPNYLWFPTEVITRHAAPEAAPRPNDQHFGKLWGMENTGQDFYPGVFWERGIQGSDINVREAWERRTDASGVLIAVIDTGIFVDHPDLNSNIWANPGEIPGNGIDDDGNGFIDDVYGWDFFYGDETVYHGSQDQHGTHCSGTIGGVGNNEIGVAGIAWKARIMSVKFLGPGGGPTSGAIKAVNYASMMGAKIASNSWGGGGYSRALEEAIANSGMLFVAAAGNSGVDCDLYPHYPSSYNLPNIIAVAATDWNDQIADFSNYGQDSVDIAAPGCWILSANYGSGYVWMGGTSMATPHVSGAALLVASEYPDMPLYPGAPGHVPGSLTVKDLILKSADKLPSLEGKMTTGGRLNVGYAIKQKFPVEIVSAAADVTMGSAPLTVNFSAQLGDLSNFESCLWIFDGDFQSAVFGLTARHTFENEGAHFAEFLVIGVDNAVSYWPIQIVVANEGTIVYVDRQGGFAFYDDFLDAADRTDLSVVRVEGRLPLGLDPSITDRMIAWDTGLTWTQTLIPEHREFLTNYLDNGGRLLMIGPRLVGRYSRSDLDPADPFVVNYLQVMDVMEDIGLDHVYGVDDDYITDGMSFDLEIGLGIEDALLPSLNARPIFADVEEADPYSDYIPAIRYASEDYRMVFSTLFWPELPVDGDDPNNSPYLIKRIYNYLTGGINVPPTIDSMRADRYFVEAGQNVTFTAAAHDTDAKPGDELIYQWLFINDSGDSEPVEAFGRTVVVSLNEQGLYVALLSVVDAGGEMTQAYAPIGVLNKSGIVLVDDDDDNPRDTTWSFMEVLDELHVDYITVLPWMMMNENGAQPGLENFRVVWNCGQLGSPDEAEQRAIADYLDKRGSLFLSGQEAMFGIDTTGMGEFKPGSFAYEYLHVVGVAHDVGTDWLKGVDGDPITGGMDIKLEWPAGYDDWTDSLALRDDAVAIFKNDYDRPSALRYAGDYSLVFFAVPFEVIPIGMKAVSSADDPRESVGNAIDLMTNILAWLGAKPVVQVMAPDVGDIWHGVNEIRWTAASEEGEPLLIDIEYSSDNGATWKPIISGIENTGKYKWDTATADKAGKSLVRVIATDRVGLRGYGRSNEFTIWKVNENSLVAGPNPAQSVVNFYYKTSNGATLYIYDVAGRLVFSRDLASGLGVYAWPLVTSGGKPLANGLYLCLMVTKDGTKTETIRLVVSR